jgi:hypothetical protein
MSVQKAGCPVCGSLNHTPFERLDDVGIQLDYVFCLGCGVVFQRERPDADDLSSYYRETYRAIVQGSEAPTEKDLRVQAGRARALMPLVTSCMQEIRVHLDVGSSAGSLLREVQKLYNCKSIGIEPGDAYRSYSRQLGTRTVSDLDQLPSELRGRIDFVSMVHVLEHLAEPVRYLETIRRDWMAEEGALLLEVPNLYGHSCFEAAHLTAYSPAALKETLRRAGYEVLSLNRHGAPRSRLIPLYLTALARPDPSAATVSNSSPALLSTKWGRRIGIFWSRLATRLAPSLAWLPWPEGEDTMALEEPEE